MSFDAVEVDRLLVKTGRRCCICQTLHRVQVHHIIAKGHGGTDDIDNAMPLCPICHDEVHTGYEPGRVTRQYTPQELKGHRQRTIDQVQNGNSTPRATAWATNAERDKAAHLLSETITCLWEETYSFVVQNFDLPPNEEWRQLRRSINNFTNAISTHEYLFSDEAVSAARDIGNFCEEVISGIVEGNSDLNPYNHCRSLRGNQIRTAAWNKFTEKRPALQRKWVVVLRSDCVDMAP